MDNRSLARKLIAALIVLLLGVLYLAFFFRSNRGASLSRNPGEANRVLASAVGSKSLKQCAELKGVVVAGANYEEICRRNISHDRAFETLDATYCEGVGNVGQVDDCRVKVANAAVQKSRDLATCDGALGEKAQSLCRATYWSLKAVETGDSELCDNIADQDTRAACESGFGYQEFLNAPEDVSCRGIPASLLGQCAAMKRAIESGRVSDCYSISDPFLARRCTELVGK